MWRPENRDAVQFISTNAHRQGRSRQLFSKRHSFNRERSVFAECGCFIFLCLLLSRSHTCLHTSVYLHTYMSVKLHTSGIEPERGFSLAFPSTSYCIITTAGGARGGRWPRPEAPREEIEHTVLILREQCLYTALYPM